MNEDPRTTGEPVEAGRQSSPASRRGPRRLHSGWLIGLAIVVPVALLGALIIGGMGGPGATSGTGAGVSSSQSATINDDARGVGAVQAGTQVPGFSVPTLTGGTFRMPAGKPTILTFVNLCPTCIEDIRKIGAIQERFGDVAVLAVASDPTADRAALKEFIRQGGDPNFQLALDPESVLVQRFNAFSMDANVLVIDSEGLVTYRGPAEEQALASALTEAGAVR